jgi:hypothetical protein
MNVLTYKIYASIMENTIMAFLEDTNVLGESQGAFRKNRRPEDHLFEKTYFLSEFYRFVLAKWMF